MGNFLIWVPCRTILGDRSAGQGLGVGKQFRVKGGPFVLSSKRYYRDTESRF